MTTTSDRPMRADARRNYERIVDVARLTFTEHGVEAPLDDIAKRAHVGAGTLYRHFPTRDDLLAAALSRDMTALIERAGVLSAAADAHAALLTWLREFVTHVNVFRGLSTSVCNAVTVPGSPLRAPCEHLARAGSVLLQKAQDDGSVRGDVTGEELFLMANAMAWAADQTSATAPERLLELLADALAPRPGR